MTFRVIRKNKRVRRGISALLMGMLMIPLLGIASLAVDMARMRLARTQLQTAADASALAGVTGLPSRTNATGRATSMAAANYCLNQSIALDAGQGDIKFGTWNKINRTFTVLDPTSSVVPNAVATIPRRLTTRGGGSGPLKLWFAPMLGIKGGNAFGSAIAYGEGGGSSIGLIGLNSVTVNGSNQIDSFDPAVGYNPANPGTSGSLSSNGNIVLTGSETIYGDVHPGPTGTLTKDSSVTVTGSTTPMTTPMSFAPVLRPAQPVSGIPSTTTNTDHSDYIGAQPPNTPPKNGLTPGFGNDTNAFNGFTPSTYQLGVKVSGSPAWLQLQPYVATFGRAMYYFKGVNVGGGGRLDIGATGSARITTIFIDAGGAGQSALKVAGGGTAGMLNILSKTILYVNGDIHISGAFNTWSNGVYDPKLLQINMISGNVTLDGTTSIAAEIYAPNSTVTIQGTPEFFGSVVANNLVIGGNSQVHYDQNALAFPGAMKIHLVK